MAITLEQIKAIQPMIKQGNSADDRTWTLNGQPVYQIPLKDGTPVFVPAAIYQEIQSNPSAYSDMIKVAPPELIAANGTPAWMAANGYMQVSGLPHAMEGAPSPGFWDSLMDTAGTLVPYALAAGVGGLASGMISSGGAAGTGLGAESAMGLEGLLGGGGGTSGLGGIASGAADLGIEGMLGTGAEWGSGALGDALATAAGTGGAGAGYVGSNGLSSLPTSMPGGGSSGGVPGAEEFSSLPTSLGTVAGAGAGTAGNSIQQILANATGLPVSAFDAAGKLLPGVIGAIGANSQSSALSDLANKFDSYGAPSRARYEASMTAGFDPTTIPGYSGALDTASQSILRQLSAREGNPFGSPGGLIEANKSIVSGTALPAIQNYQSQNASSGGLASLASSYPTAATNAASSQANVWNALGGAAADIFNPTKKYSLSDLMQMYQGA